jgi:hypothetical protein
VPKIVSRSENRWALRWAIVIVALTCLPYVLAWFMAPAGTQYTGLLVNPLDGETYFAKMQHGAQGNWLFHLTFTPEDHQGIFFYPFYLLLGKIAGLTTISVPITYHLARSAGSLLLLLVAYRFIARFAERIPTRRAAFLLLGFSAGLGWLLAPLGLTTADLWVAEGFTFLTLFTNPHFPLGLALMLLVFIPMLDLRSSDLAPWHQLAGAAAASLALPFVHPTAVPVVWAVLGVYVLVLALKTKQVPWREVAAAAAVGLASVPVVVYSLIALNANPTMAAWMAQNQTPSLAPWEYILGYGLIVLLALGGVVTTLRRRTTTDLFLLSWVVSVLILLYAPLSLQRRLITGLHVPLSVLAALGLEQMIWPRFSRHRQATITALIIGFTALTNVFVPLVTVTGVAQGRHPLVIDQETASASSWLRNNTQWTDTVLAPPESGQFVAALAGNRVVYGHPFETIEAETKKAAADQFFGPDATASERRALLDNYGVRYVLAPLDTTLDPAIIGLSAVWRGAKTVLYRVETRP